MGLVGFGLLVLGGCVDMFTGRPPEGTARWRGTTSAGPVAIPECAPMAIDLAIYEHPLYMPALVDGRAYPMDLATGIWPRTVDAATTWWVDGYMNPAQFVQFETKRQRPIYFRAKPYAVWRGSLVDDRIVLDEAGSPCGRELVLTRG
jgi:hypothetical protein